MAERALILITGRVQGVFYRHSARIHGEKLGLAGTIENLPDGTVKIVAEGGRENIEEFIAWCRSGPTLARVDAVTVGWEQPSGDFERFEIK